MARHARTLGIPAERVLRFHIAFSNEPDAGTMREEARLLLPFLQARGVRKVLVIAPALQSRRKALVLGRWQRAGIRVRIHPMPDSGFRAAGWWRRQSDTKRVVGEALSWVLMPLGH